MKSIKIFSSDEYSKVQEQANELLMDNPYLTEVKITLHVTPLREDLDNSNGVTVGGMAVALYTIMLEYEIKATSGH